MRRKEKIEKKIEKLEKRNYLRPSFVKEEVMDAKKQESTLKMSVKVDITKLKKRLTKDIVKKIENDSLKLKEMHKKGLSITTKGWATRYDARLQ